MDVDCGTKESTWFFAGCSAKRWQEGIIGGRVRWLAWLLRALDVMLCYVMLWYVMVVRRSEDECLFGGLESSVVLS